MFGFNKYRNSFVEATHNIGSYMTTAMLRLKQEDIGWTPLSGLNNDGTIPLDVIKQHAERARMLVALNPLVKRGLVVRNAYMWTDPIEFDGDSIGLERNEKSVFSVAARVRDETAFSTDGCVTYIVNKSAKVATPVPIERFGGVAKDSVTGEVYAVLISPASGKEKAKWFVLHDKPFVEVDDPGHETERSLRAVYYPVNCLVGESIGKPDLISALYYAQAYKEYLETAHLMTKALARIAYKTTSVNARQQQAVTTRMATTGVGATASIGSGQDITAVSKAGAGIEFSAGTPLASMVSAALDIPLSVLLTDGSAGGRQGAETALEDPTFKALELRRSVHADLLKQVAAALGMNFEMKYGAINNDQTHRRVQSIVLAYNSGALHQAEMRAGILQILQVPGAGDVEDLPDVIPLNAGVGPLSDGTNDNRDNPTDA